MLSEWAAFSELAKAFAEGEACLRVAGLTGSARAMVVAGLAKTHPRPLLVVAATLADAHRFTQDLKFFGTPAVEFPEREPRLWRGGRQRESDAERAVVCRRLLAGEPLVVVATPTAIDVPLPSPTEFREATLRFTTGDSLDRELLIEALEKAGYERTDTVVEVGQWSVRGGIVDVFSPAQTAPARLEFFGDEIESIRLFDPTSQRSQATLDELLVLPLHEDGASAEAGRGLLDYLPPTASVVVDSPKLLDATDEDAPERPPLGQRLGGRQRLELELVEGATGPAGLTLDTRSVTQHAGKFTQLAEEIAGWRREGFTVRLAAADDRQADHVQQILREHGVEAIRAASIDAPEGLAIVVGECSSGFSIPALGLILVTETEMFGARRRTLRRPKYQRGSPISAFTDLEVGDLVVHEDHGIGKYLGLKTMAVGDRDGDFLLLEYAENNRLYLPVDRLDLISKYMGGDSTAARLDRLGGASWQRVKDSVRAALREMAEELLRLYAKRTVADGHRFPSGSRRPPISSAPSKRPSATWKASGRWTASSPGTSATARRRSRFAPRSRRWPMAPRWPCWSPPRCWPSSTGRRSWTASRRSRPRSSCSLASARRRSRRPSWRGSAWARSMSSSAPIACCRRTSSSRTSASWSSTRSIASASPTRNGSSSSGPRWT
ncbi:MAG: hypothetical protein AUH18_08125 [Candidatus Rokubacteria bacterium 13_2_20CM_69_10]|nr:MAG: hypothetical protein AUH18_08125 [Candidatus Rokubacteria bacterium 13_2_20CM_69_10]